MLAPGGRLLSVSFAAPRFRAPLLAAGALPWRVAHTTFGVDWHWGFFDCAPLAPGEPREAAPEEVPFALPYSLEQEDMDGDAWLQRVGDGG